MQSHQLRVVGRSVVPDIEIREQRKWCNEHPFRVEAGIPNDTPVVVVRGNHDFIDLNEWIGGNVWEVSQDSSLTTEILGLKIGGMRGINYIQGEWCDETSQEELMEIARKIPTDIDILVSHAPGTGVLDYTRDGNCGVNGIAAFILRKYYLQGSELRAHFCGHVHEDIGVLQSGGTLYSNAADAVHVVNI